MLGDTAEPFSDEQWSAITDGDETAGPKLSALVSRRSASNPLRYPSNC